jgi:hypothetical protein
MCFLGLDQHRLQLWGRRTSSPWRDLTRRVRGRSRSTLCAGHCCADRRSTTGRRADFHPGREVHRCRIRPDVKVGQISEDIAGRDVERPAERDCQMGEVTADTVPGQVDVNGAGQGRRAAVLEGQVAVHVVADGLDPAVTWRQPAEAGPRLIAQHVRQAVAAWQGEDQRVIGYAFWSAGIGVLSGVLDLRHRSVAEARPARGEHRLDAGVGSPAGTASLAAGSCRRGRGLRSRVCLAGRSLVCQPEWFCEVRGSTEPLARAALRGGRRERNGTHA